ncbi:MAG: carboxypeptidase regulatory-like domain-containing protein [Acidobacteria bacterium]|nr:carboxypeptidase regulatory-like domain-containing protein [Acidobacteriota bacterium]MBV9929044.1 carboxypeptidase regulatory-like domain-containing protein [Acidobacteriota bacterium]
MTPCIPRILLTTCAALLLCAPAAFAQERGRLTGRVLDSPGTMPKGVGGAVVVAVNQISSRAYRAKTKADGSYTLGLPAGAYRVRLEAPFKASFDSKVKYGPFAIARGEAVENVGVEPGQDTKLDIVLAPKEGTPAPSTPPPGKGDEGEPNGYAGSSSVATEAPTAPDRVPVRDRWRISFPEYERYGGVSRGRDILFRHGSALNPYDQSILKGDYPIFGQHVFMILSGTSFTAVQQQRTPIPSNPSSARPGTAEAFNKPEVLAFNQVLQFSLEMFSGDTTFKPRQWAIKLSPTFSVPNYVRAREQGVINIDPRRGTTRTDWHFSFEEAFAEVKLEDVNANYDAISIRAGIQPFVSDFRGFIYADNNLGARIFGAFKNNQYQFNLAYFAQLEKDTNSGLNRFDRRRQNVYVANLFKQDFLAKGYTAQASFHFNDDRAGIEYDRNGFKVRPAVVGDVRPHSLKVGYFGLSGDGHVGRINLTNSYYFALGTDSRNPIAGRKTRVRAQMAAAEASLDKDFQRFRASFFFASGDKNPTDGKATGFDAILDDPNFAGGQFSFWNRVGIPLVGTGVGLVQPLSLLPSLRSSKTQGQANYVNPGIVIGNLGYDIELTQRIKAVFNFNHLRFQRTEPLEYLLFQNHIRHDIGEDLSVGVAYRPRLINNITLNFGASMLKPGRGFRDIYTDRSRNCPPNVASFCTPDDTVINPSKPLYALFGTLRFNF